MRCVTQQTSVAASDRLSTPLDCKTSDAVRYFALLLTSVATTHHVASCATGLIRGLPDTSPHRTTHVSTQRPWNHGSEARYMACLFARQIFLFTYLYLSSHSFIHSFIHTYIRPQETRMKRRSIVRYEVYFRHTYTYIWMSS